jgi:hypothetical protein
LRDGTSKRYRKELAPALHVNLSAFAPLGIRPLERGKRGFGRLTHFQSLGTFLLRADDDRRSAKEDVMKTVRWLLVLSFLSYGFLGSASAQEEKKSAKAKEAEVQAVISAVGQRTITFQVERKGKVREEVVGIDEKTDIEKDGSKIKLKDLQETDKAVIKYEPDAYTPAISVKVTGKGELQKVGGED